jgi:hypothetical protein
MKSVFCVIIAITSLSIVLAASAADPSTSATPAPDHPPARIGSAIPERKLFDDTYQFIFFATLEGLYREGVSDEDVNSLLATEGKDGGYLNFIYTCPICMPVEAAIVTYKVRPRIDRMKIPNYQTSQRTFGFGLPDAISIAIRSEKPSVRLGAVNNLVSKWISYRMDHSSLSGDQKNALIEDLKKKRKEGMEALRSFAKNWNGPNSMKAFAAGYQGGDECAICNGALQMPLKLKSTETEK